MDSVPILQVIASIDQFLRQSNLSRPVRSASCRETYGLPDYLSVKKGEDETRALCISEYSDISPLRDGVVAFSSLEGRPSAYNFENSVELQVSVVAWHKRQTLSDN